ncbi:MAG: DUF1566 domain-containing protein [Chloroflexi bacterium]|nr:DUF1566 domain-containing protein [Chloroflexota bacterium]
MKLNYKHTTYILALITAVLTLALPITFNVLAGNIDSSAAPNATNSYTLEDIYNRLDASTAGSQSVFAEPAAGPGSTMHDLNSIMGVAPALDAANGASAADVANGKTFWGLTSGQWGVQTGTGIISATYAAAVPKTGQTISYATGDDGDLERGVAWPNPRFTDNSDGTVTDNLTGLIWLKDANCFSGRNWTTALSDTNSLADGSCGLSDSSSAGNWRLPNIRELHSLIDFSQYTPALPVGYPFTAVQSTNYWSSTTDNCCTFRAWSVDLTSGFIFNGDKGFSYYVWPVRAGQ